MYTPTHKTSPLVAKTQSIAREIAAAHASDVDVRARFPQETIDALKQAKLMTVGVPKELGGEGANLQELTAMCFTLGQCCG